MCLVLFAHQARQDDALILLANRDEFHARPTAPAHFWPDVPGLLAGRDRVAGGSWLGVTRGGRFAAVTNYREGIPSGDWPRSRGALVVEFLQGAQSAEAFLSTLCTRIDDFAPFNLLLGDQRGIWLLSSTSGEIEQVPLGVHGLSNHLLDSDWPKIVRGRAALTARIGAPVPPDDDSLFAILSDQTPVDDAALPDTGVGIDWERRLAPVFISGAEYGTRSSTLLRVSRAGRVDFCERSFGPRGETVGEVRYRIEADADPTG